MDPLNLAFIEIHKGSAPMAFTYFHKALNLPESLDEESKTRVLWSMARLHYAENEIQKALAVANEALDIEKPPKALSLFTVAVYAALLKEDDLCLSRLRSAIELDSALFARAAVDPDLEVVRPKVLNMLGEIATQTKLRASEALSQFRHKLGNAEDGTFAASYDDLLELIRQRLDKNNRILLADSFTDSVLLQTLVSKLTPALTEIPFLDSSYNELAKAQDAVEKAEERHRTVEKKNRSRAENKPSPLRGSGLNLELGFPFLVTYSLTGLCCAVGLFKTDMFLEDWGELPILIVFWPIAFVGGLTGTPAQVGLTIIGTSVGIMLSAGIIYLLYFLPERLWKSAQQRLACSEAHIRDVRSTLPVVAERINRQRQTIIETLSF